MVHLCCRSDCTFVHPTKMCSLGDSCTRGEQCTYIHVSDLKGSKDQNLSKTLMQSGQRPENVLVACKFGSSCLKPDCPFGHPSAPNTALSQQTSRASIQCKFDPKCLKPGCPFSHPSRSTPLSTVPATASDIPCKYDPFCARPGCLFKHSEKTLTLKPSAKFLPASNEVDFSPTIITNNPRFDGNLSSGSSGKFRNKTLVLNGHISQRGFAVSDNEVEKVNMEVE